MELHVCNNYLTFMSSLSVLACCPDYTHNEQTALLINVSILS